MPPKPVSRRGSISSFSLYSGGSTYASSCLEYDSDDGQQTAQPRTATFLTQSSILPFPSRRQDVGGSDLIPNENGRAQGLGLDEGRERVERRRQLDGNDRAKEERRKGVFFKDEHDAEQPEPPPRLHGEDYSLGEASIQNGTGLFTPPGSSEDDSIIWGRNHESERHDERARIRPEGNDEGSLDVEHSINNGRGHDRGPRTRSGRSNEEGGLFGGKGKEKGTGYLYPWGQVFHQQHPRGGVFQSPRTEQQEFMDFTDKPRQRGPKGKAGDPDLAPDRDHEQGGLSHYAAARRNIPKKVNDIVGHSFPTPGTSHNDLRKREERFRGLYYSQSASTLAVDRMPSDERRARESNMPRFRMQPLFLSRPVLGRKSSTNPSEFWEFGNGSRDVPVGGHGDVTNARPKKLTTAASMFWGRSREVYSHISHPKKRGKATTDIDSELFPAPLLTPLPAAGAPVSPSTTASSPLTTPTVPSWSPSFHGAPNNRYHYQQSGYRSRSLDEGDGEGWEYPSVNVNTKAFGREGMGLTEDMPRRPSMSTTPDNGSSLAAPHIDEQPKSINTISSGSGNSLGDKGKKGQSNRVGNFVGRVLLSMGGGRPSIQASMPALPKQTVNTPANSKKRAKIQIVAMF